MDEESEKINIETEEKEREGIEYKEELIKKYEEIIELTGERTSSNKDLLKMNDFGLWKMRAEFIETNEKLIKKTEEIIKFQETVIERNDKIINEKKMYVDTLNEKLEKQK